MQHIPLILITLAILCAALVFLRQCWPGLTARSRNLFLASAILAILLFIGSTVTHWTTISDRVNSLLDWGATAGYLLLLTIHSLNRPRWITSISAAILAASILASSILLPLGRIFHPAPRRIVSLGDNLYVSWQAFDEWAPASSGTDIDVVYRPPLLPFLQRSRLGGRFYNLRCNAAATEVTLQPDRHTVFVRCPPWPSSGEIDPGSYIRLH